MSLHSHPTARLSNVVVRVLVAGGLAVDAFVHLDLAGDYQLAAPGGIGGGTLFRLEAAVAVLAGLYVLVRGSRRAFVIAMFVGLAGLVAVVVYRYVDVSAFGPLPSMYEPIWYPEKTLSAVAEGVAAITAGAGAMAARHSMATTQGDARSANADLDRTA